MEEDELLEAREQLLELLWGQDGLPLQWELVHLWSGSGCVCVGIPHAQISVHSRVVLNFNKDVLH